MKRWFVVALIALAVLVLLSPGLIGMLAERRINEQLETAAAYDPDFDLRTLAFERGWFTSAGKHRVPVRDPLLAELLTLLTPGAARADGQPVLVITTVLDHGLVSVSGAARDPSTLVPALANGVSTLELELADGRLLPVPGELRTRINLNGSAVLDYRLPAGAARRDGQNAEWSGATLRLEASADGRAFGLDGDLGDWRVQTGSLEQAFSAVEFAVAAQATPYGFFVGDARLAMSEFRASNGVAVQRVALDAASALDGERAGADLTLAMRGLETPDGRFDADLVSRISGLNAATLGPLLRGLQRGFAAAGGTPGDGIAAPYPEFDIDLRRLLSDGGALTLERLAVGTPDGDIDATLTLTLPDSGRLAAWTGLALAAEAAAEVSVGRGLVEGGPLAESLRPLVAGGFLVLDGDAYRLDAAYANGVATINGAPLTIPLSVDQP